jgi:hypothetical protein
MKIKTLYIIFCFFTFDLAAQQPTLEWMNVDPVLNIGTMCIDSSGNVFIAGDDFPIQPYGFGTAKYSSSGQLLWRTHFGGGQIALPKSMGCDSLGNVYIFANELGWLVVKYSPNGNQLWFKRFSGEHPRDMIVQPNGEFILTGDANNQNTGSDCYTVKCNSAGDTIWTATYTFNNLTADVPNAIDKSFNHNLAVSGYTFSSNVLSKILTFKYDVNGVFQWARTYNYNNNIGNSGEDIAFDRNGNIYNLAFVAKEGSSEPRYCTIKYLPNGDTAWVRIYHHSQNNWDSPTKIAIDKKGDVIITGGCFGNDSAFMANYTTIKYNSDGILLWENRFGWFEPILPPPNDLFVDNLNNSYITGRRNIAPGFNFNRFELIAIKYDENGAQKWLLNYLSPDSISGGNNIIVDKNFNVYINGTGKYNSLRGSLIMKYSQLIGIEPISNEIPNRYRLFQNYPNPFNPVTKIKFSVPKLNAVKLLIYDVLGKEIKTLVNEELKPGVYEIDFNASQYSSGVYFYRLVTGDFEETKKMLLIK